MTGLISWRCVWDGESCFPLGTMLRATDPSQGQMGTRRWIGQTAILSASRNQLVGGSRSTSPQAKGSNDGY
jgi:hypothetical protein